MDMLSEWWNKIKVSFKSTLDYCGQYFTSQDDALESYVDRLETRVEKRLERLENPSPDDKLAVGIAAAAILYHKIKNK